MKPKSLAQTGLAAVGMITQVTARVYLIDPVSCTAAQADWVRSALTGAFALAQAGVNAATSPLGQDQTTLITSLFGGTDSARLGYVNRYLGTNTGVLGFNTEETDQTRIGPDDIKFYCNQKRFKYLTREAKNPLHYYDPDAQATVRISAKLDCQWALMYTQVQDNFIQIQICPWFLKYSMANKFKTHADVTNQIERNLASGLPNLIRKLAYTKIDILGLDDKCFLHEMTHALPVSNLQFDVEDVGGLGGYGWKNCRKLSTVVTNNPRELPNIGATILGPELNADSWALYGSAAFLIEQGGAVNEDGTFTGPPASES